MVLKVNTITTNMLHI